MPQTKQKIIDEEITENTPSSLDRIRNCFPVWEHYNLGRKSQCTPQTAEIICEILADGNYIETAVTAVGIGERTYYDWMQWAKRDEEEGKYAGWSGAPDESIYIAFSQMVKQARAIAEVGLVREIRHDRDNKTFAPLAWILERTRQDKFGQRQQIDVTHTITGPSVPVEQPQTHQEWLARVEEEKNLLQAQAEDAEYNETNSESGSS